MPELKVNRDFDAAAEKVWALLVNFGDIQAWWPTQLERVDVEGQGPGMIRHMYTGGFEHPVSERLDSLDHDNMTIRLSIIGEMPAGMTEYRATGTLTRTGTDSCSIEYRSEFQVEDNMEDAASGFLLGAYEAMFKGLGDTAKLRP
jgi:uncharacterized protein YndB with AHSA1/START domain